MAILDDVRWGVLATGTIAHAFATDLALVDGSRLAAVGSRDLDTARAFARRHGADRAHGSYADLLADPGVDVVYVATPHSRHAEDVAACLDAGKAVLCEKPLTLDHATSAVLVERARTEGLFLAEAMWMRANPNIRRLSAMVQEGRLGRLAQLRAELGFLAPADVTRLWDPALGASALLDIGVYPLAFAHLVLGEPETVVAAGTLHERGFDTGGGATLVYPGGAVASIAWTQLARSDNRASVSGDAGRIEVPARFHEPQGFSLVRGDNVLDVREPIVGAGYAYEILEVERCLREGRTESALLSLDDTLVVMEQMDDIRAQIAAEGLAP